MNDDEQGIRIMGSSHLAKMELEVMREGLRSVTHLLDAIVVKDEQGQDIGGDVRQLCCLTKLLLLTSEAVIEETRQPQEFIFGTD